MYRCWNARTRSKTSGVSAGTCKRRKTIPLLTWKRSLTISRPTRRYGQRLRLGITGRLTRPSFRDSYTRVFRYGSSENQFNYKAAYDLAVQTGGQNLPVTFKLGADDEPYYRTFETVSDLQDFYVKAMKHIQDALSEGWKKKDALDLALYEAG